MQTVKSVQLEQILDYLDPGVAFIKIDSEGKDCMVRSFASSISFLFGKNQLIPTTIYSREKKT